MTDERIVPCLGEPDCTPSATPTGWTHHPICPSASVCPCHNLADCPEQPCPCSPDCTPTSCAYGEIEEPS